DGVGEGVHRGGVRLVPLHGDLDRYAVALFLEGDDRRMRRVLLGIDVFDVVGQASLVVVGVDGRTAVGVFGTLVADGDGQPLVEEGHLLHPAGQRLVGERGGLENTGIGPEGDLGSGLLGRLTLDEVAGRRGRFVVLAPHVSVAANLHVQGFGQRVDDGDTDTVQTTRDGVRLVVELAAGVQRGQDQ